jgi:hypothetical protein
MRKLLVFVAVAALAVPALADEVVLDQIGPDPTATENTGVIAASQDFEADFDIYDVGILDDFVLDTDFTLTSVEAVLGFWNGIADFVNIQSYRVEIYSSPGAAGSNLTGDVASLQGLAYDGLEDPFGGSQNRGKVLFNVDIPLEAGEYWLAVIPRMDFSGIGQVGVSGSEIGATDCWQANPGQGFGMGTHWQPGYSAGYRIMGIPEPASLTLLALGGLALLRRR